MKEELKIRTMKFAINAVKFSKGLKKTEEGRILGKQFLRSSTSVAANYRASLRARSTAEFIAKIGIVVEEADESAFWLELMIESEIITLTEGEILLKESNELLRIFSATRKTAKDKLKIKK